MKSKIDFKYKRTIKSLIERLKFKRFTKNDIEMALFDYLKEVITTESIVGSISYLNLKDRVNTIRHCFCNYEDLCKELHMIGKSRKAHVKFRTKVNEIIKERYWDLIK